MDAKDILFIVLALSIATLTAFLAWFLYYLIAIVRELRQAAQLIHQKIEEVGGVLESIKEKISDSVSILSLLTNVVSKVAGSWKTRRSKRSSSDQPDE